MTANCSVGTEEEEDCNTEIAFKVALEYFKEDYQKIILFSFSKMDFAP